MGAIEAIRGTSRVALARHADARGVLVAFGDPGPLPFEVRRLYYMFGVPEGVARAGHAVSCHTALVAVAGGVTIDLDDGHAQATTELRTRDEALVLEPGVWLRLRDLDPGTVLLGLASLAYEETRYFDGPAVELLAGHAA